MLQLIVSRYIQAILNHKIEKEELVRAISTHKINFNLLNEKHSNECNYLI